MSGEFDAESFLRKLERIRNAPARMEDEFYTQAQELLVAAQSNCPVDTGELVASGHVVMGAEGPEVVFNAPHAAAVHERFDLVHPNGGPKYLERAILDNREKFFEESQQAFNREVES